MSEDESSLESELLQVKSQIRQLQSRQRRLEDRLQRTREAKTRREADKVQAQDWENEGEASLCEFAMANLITSI